MLYNETKKIINKNNLKLKKGFGQNFLTNESILEDIIDIADISPEENVLEIGPGIGVLTQYLLDRAKKVTVVEIDDSLIPVLNERFALHDNLEIINADILKWEGLLELQEPLKIVANLPYYITTPILMRILESGVKYSSLTLMVQKEVAERICATNKDKAYGAISLAVAYRATAEVKLIVPPSAFIPPPKVDSAVINIVPHKEPPVSVMDEDFLFKTIKAGFSQRRKTLANALANNRILDYNKEDFYRVFESVGLPQNVRAESLSLEDFAKLSDALLRNKEV